MSRPEITQNVLFSVSALLRPNDHYFVASEAGKAAHNSPVLGVEPISMQLAEAGESGIKIVEGKRPLRMTGNFHAIPGTQIEEDLPLGFFEFLFNQRNF